MRAKEATGATKRICSFLSLPLMSDLRSYGLWDSIEWFALWVMRVGFHFLRMHQIQWKNLFMADGIANATMRMKQSPQSTHDEATKANFLIFILQRQSQSITDKCQLLRNCNFHFIPNFILVNACRAHPSKFSIKKIKQCWLQHICSAERRSQVLFPSLCCGLFVCTRVTFTRLEIHLDSKMKIFRIWFWHNTEDVRNTNTK